MDRTSTSRDKHHSSVRAVGVAALDVVLPGTGRNDRKLGAHVCDRRAVSQDTVLREPQDGRNVWLQPQTDPATDGHRGDLPQCRNYPAGSHVDRHIQEFIAYMARPPLGGSILYAS